MNEDVLTEILLKTDGDQYPALSQTNQLIYKILNSQNLFLRKSHLNNDQFIIIIVLFILQDHFIFLHLFLLVNLILHLHYQIYKFCLIFVSQVNFFFKLKELHHYMLFRIFCRQRDCYLGINSLHLEIYEFFFVFPLFLTYLFHTYYILFHNV